MSVKQLNIDEWKAIPCECGKKAVHTTIRYKQYEVRGWKCKCGKQYIHPEDSVKISKLERLRSVEVKVGMLGRSAILRIPKDISEIYGIRKGMRVRLTPEDLRKIEIRRM